MDRVNGGNWLGTLPGSRSGIAASIGDGFSFTAREKASLFDAEFDANHLDCHLRSGAIQRLSLAFLLRETLAKWRHR